MSSRTARNTVSPPSLRRDGKERDAGHSEKEKEREREREKDDGGKSEKLDLKDSQERSRESKERDSKESRERITIATSASAEFDVEIQNARLQRVESAHLRALVADAGQIVKLNVGGSRYFTTKVRNQQRR